MTTDDKPTPAEVKIPDPKPIDPGQAFIGLCTLRNGAFHMLWLRVQAGVASNTAGLAAAIYQLATEPSVFVIIVLLLGALIATNLNGYWRQLLASGVSTVEYWTEELVQLEEKNGIGGGCKIFHRANFPAPGPKPRVPKVLLYMRRTCIVLWWLVFVVALAELFMKLEVKTWISPYLSRYCS